MKIQGRLINGYYKKTSKDEFTLFFVVLVRDQGEIKKITIPIRPNFKPYVYCTGQAIGLLKSCFREIKADCYIKKDMSVKLMGKPDEIPYKVEVDTPDKFGQIKRLNTWKSNLDINNNHLFEANVKYFIRYMIDNDLGIWLEFDLEKGIVSKWENPDISIEPRVLFYDIEVIDGKIVTYSYGDSLENLKHYDHYEEELLLYFKNVLMPNYDYFVSWTDFDEVMLKKRAEKLNINIDWGQICFIDQAFVIRKTHKMFTGRTYLSLDEAGERVCGIRKIEMPKGLNWYYKHDKEKFRLYNNRDVEIQIKIEESCGKLFDWQYAVESVGLPMEYVKYISVIPLTDIMREIRKLPTRIVLPTGRKDVSGKKYRGASVTENPPYGVFFNVFAVDLVGSYVGIIRTYFRYLQQFIDIDDTIAAVMSLIPDILDRKTQMRNEFKRQRNQAHKGSREYKRFDSMQGGMKVVSLTYYGELGRKGSPVYVLDCAQFITDMGREHIFRAEKKLEENFQVERHYRDTDSIYWSFLFDLRWTKSTVKQMFKKVLDIINQDYDIMLDMKNIPVKDRYVRMDAQAFYESIVWAGIAKNYMGKEKYSADTDEWHEVSKLFIKGWVKLGRGKLALDVQHLIGRLLLDGVDFKTIIGYLQCIKDDILRGNYTEYLVQRTGFSMPLDKFKSKTFVWYAAKRAKEQGKFEEKTEFKWIVVSEQQGKVRAEAVYEGIIPKVKRSGLLYMFNHYILSKAMAPLKAIEQSEEFIKAQINISQKGDLF